MPWVINYHNYSSTTLNITQFGGITQDVVGETNHQPGATLATGASDDLSLDQNAFSFIADGDIDFYQGIGQPGSMLWVRVHVPLQMFGIGTGPYWYYLVNTGEAPSLGDGGWQQHDSDTVDLQVGGFAVTISPNLDHSDITLDVTFDDAS